MTRDSDRMTTEEKITVVLRSEDNCRWVRDRLLDLAIEEEMASG